MDSPAPLESPVGILQAQVPAWAAEPPIEAVVFAWGASEDHQLGGDGSDAVWSPKVVESLLGVRFRGREFRRAPLIAGSRNTLAIDAEGQVWSWGWNARGTLGHGHRSAERKPRMVAGLQGVKIVQAALGGWHCLALDDAGQVHAWGGNEYAQCDELVPARDLLVPQPCMPQLRVAQVACGGMSSMVLTTGGDVWTWGEPWGDFTLDMSRTPRQVQGAVDIAAIAAGGFHNMALNRAGEVLTWGTNDYGQLGNGSTSYSMEPSKVVDLEEVPISDIAAGGWHSVALAADGSIIVWGRGEYGRLGIRDRTGSSKLRPFKVLGMEGHVVVQVAAGGTHTMALTSEGRMFVWGRASYGRLGLGERARDVYEPEECVLPGGHDRWKIAAITCGGRHSMCLAVPMRDVAAAGVLLVNGVEGEVDLSAAAVSSSGGAGGGGEEPTAPIRSPGRMGSVTMRPSASFGSLRDAAMAAAAVPPAASSSSSGGAAAPSPGASSGGAAGAGNATQYPTSRFAAAAAAAGMSAGGASVTGGSPGSDSAALSGSASRASSGRAPSSPSTRSTSAGASGLAATLVSVGSGSLGRTNSSVAAMAAAAAAAGGRVSTGVRSPVMGGSGGSSARAFDGEAAARNLGAGEQAPMSPRAYPPPMSPSQSRARHGGLVSSLADYPSFSGGFGGGNMEEEDSGGGGGGGGGEDGDGAQGADSYEEDVQGVDEAGDEEDPAANPGATRGSLGQLVGSAAWQEGGAGFLLLQQHQQQQAKELLLRATSGSAAGGQGMPRSPSRNALAQIASFGSFTEYEQAMAGAGSPSRTSSVAGPSRGGATTDSSRAPSAGGASPPGPLLTSPTVVAAAAAAAAAAAGGSGTDPRQAWQGLGGVPNLPPVATGAPVPDAAAGGRSSSRASGSGPELSGSGSGARVSATGAAELARAGSGTSSYSGHMGSGSGSGLARLHSGSIRVGSPSVLEPEEAAAALEAHQQQLRQQQEQQAQNLAQEGLHPRVALLLRSESTHENLNVPEAEEVSRQNSAGGASPSGASPREGHGRYDVGMSEAESRPSRNLHSHLS